MIFKTIWGVQATLALIQERGWKDINTHKKLISETKGRLERAKHYLEDLESCLSGTNTTGLTKDARHYIDDEITKAKGSIEYYSGILKVLEDKWWI